MPRVSSWFRRVTVPIIALAAALSVCVGVASPAGASTPRIVDLKVSFTVRNVDRSAVACPADGRTYTVRGDLVAPASVLTSPRKGRAVTLYLHGLSFGEFFWNFTAVKGYNYARKLAVQGQASLIIDRLGYGRSGKPNGFGICAGARADVAHQIVQQLRSGHYRAPAGGRRFGRVYLAGHSYGGQIAQIEAYSFGGINGLIVVSYTDVGQTALLQQNANYVSENCAAGGQPATSRGPAGYSPFGAPAAAARALFHDVSAKVKKKTLAKLTKDPCGDGASFAKATKVDLKQLHKIHVPVLLIQGGSDALFNAKMQHAQAKRYTGAASVSTFVVPHTGHAITLEKTRDTFADEMARTLSRFERR